jgi:hypothetical protein
MTKVSELFGVSTQSVNKTTVKNIQKNQECPYTKNDEKKPSFLKKLGFSEQHFIMTKEQTLTLIITFIVAVIMIILARKDHNSLKQGNMSIINLSLSV